MMAGLMSGVRLVSLMLLMLVIPLVAQESKKVAPMPPAPAGRILDDARLFSLHPQELERLSDRLAEISERTGYQIYAAIFDSLIGTSLKEQSRLLQEAWIGEKPGVVLVLESDSSVYQIGWSRTPDAVTEAGQKVPLLATSDLAPQDQVRIFDALSLMESDGKGSMESAAKLITAFSDEIDQAFKEVDAVEPARWNARVLILGAGLLAGLLLIGLIIGAWIRHTDRKVTEQLVFPKVTVGMRLGAQCGGGKISWRTFDVLPREKV